MRRMHIKVRDRANEWLKRYYPMVERKVRARIGRRRLACLQFKIERAEDENGG